MKVSDSFVLIEKNFSYRYLNTLATWLLGVEKDRENEKLWLRSWVGGLSLRLGYGEWL